MQQASADLGLVYIHAGAGGGAALRLPSYMQMGSASPPARRATCLEIELNISDTSAQTWGVLCVILVKPLGWR